MGFSGLLKANFLGPQPGQGGTKMRWELTEALSFTFVMTPADAKVLRSLQLGSEQINITKLKGKKREITITVPEHFVTDLASIPRPVWSLISPWDVARAAVIHDLLYQTLREIKDQIPKQDKDAIRAASDKVFLEGMLASEPAISKWKINACYQSVKIFGRWAI